MAATEGAFANVAHLPTVFDPETLIDKGLCEVADKSHSLYYEVHGDRNATEHVVFIMGLINSCFGWDNQVHHLARQAGVQVLVFDNKGVGNSDLAKGFYTTANMAKETNELLDHVGWTKDRSVHVVGVSMGGMIGQRVVLQNPARIASLFLLSSSTASSFDLPPLKGLRAALVLFTISPFLGRDYQVNSMCDTLFPPEFLDVPNPDQSGDKKGKTRRKVIEEDFMHRHTFARKQPALGAFSQLGAVLTHRVTADEAKQIAKLTPHVCIVAGDQDCLINHQRSIEMHGMMDGSDLHIIKGGGHALPYQIPEELNRILDEAIKKGREASERRRTSRS